MVPNGGGAACVSPAVDGASHHSAYVRVDDGYPLPVREACHRTSGVGADSGQQQQCLDVVGDDVVVFGSHYLGAFV